MRSTFITFDSSEQKALVPVCWRSTGQATIRKSVFASMSASRQPRNAKAYPFFSPVANRESINPLAARSESLQVKPASGCGEALDFRSP